jgi:hypothetical protein
VKVSTLYLALKSKGKLVLDLVDRAVFTFGAAFLAVYLPVIMGLNGSNWHSLTDLSILQKAAVAGGAAVATLIKSLVGSFIGNKNNGAVLSKTDNLSDNLIEVPVVLPPEAVATTGDTTVDVSTNEVEASETDVESPEVPTEPEADTPQ